MSTARDKVIQYLQDARAAEYALTTLLAVNIAVTLEGDYRRRVESQRQRSRERDARLSERLGELGARRTLRYLAFGAARVAGGQALSFATLPLQLLRGPGGEERLLKNARDLCAVAAVLTADYRTLEHIAHASGDEVTAKLAVDLRAETDDLQSECFAALDRLADAVITAEVRGEPVYQVGRTGAVQMLQLPQLLESISRLSSEAAEGLRQGRRGTMRLDARAIIPDYDAISVEEIRNRLTRLTQAELATIEAYERKTLNRASVLEAINDLRGTEPWTGYDEMTVTEVRERLREMDRDKTQKVIQYERSHKSRSSILDASETQPSTTPSTRTSARRSS